MAEKDYRQGSNDYRVQTQVLRGNNLCMGDSIIVTARDEKHAEEVARNHGHDPNPHFPPKNLRR